MVDMTVLPGFLGPSFGSAQDKLKNPLRLNARIRLGFEPLRLNGGKVIFKVSQHQFVNYPG